MGGTTLFNGKSSTPYDASHAIPLGIEGLQEALPVTLDAYFNDPVTGARCSRAIIVTVSGLVNVEFASGRTALIPVISGSCNALIAKVFKVQSSGTTATGIFWAY